jgi:arylsulfatase A-like enzyme
MFEDRSTLATWLRAAGYRTSLVGKYLNGYGKRDANRDGELTPADQVYVPPGWTDFQALLDPTAALMLNYTINDNGRLVAAGGQERDYQTEILMLRAIRFIDESEKTDDAAPFFLYVAPIAPHQGEKFADAEPVAEDDYSYYWRWTIRPASRYKGTISLPLPQLPSFNEADISDKPSWLQLRPQLTALDVDYAGRLYRDRLESMRSVDDLVGGLIAALARNGELQNTVLIFTSDNGFLMGEHRLPQKMAPYEESVRVPLFVAVPGYLGGFASNGVVLNTDLAPTITHLAGVTPGLTTDGVSLVPLLTQPNLKWRQRLLIEQWRGNMGIFGIPDFGAVRTAPNSTLLPNLLYAEYSAGAGPEPEMYDMTADPHQLRSIHADSSPARINQRKLLKAWLDALRSCTGRGCTSLEF